jgi:hypothetical protein
MKQTGWNRRDFLKAGIQVAGVAGVGMRPIGFNPYTRKSRTLIG